MGIKYLITGIVITSLLGCHSTEVITSDQLRGVSSKSMNVFLHNGNIVRFEVGKYNFIETADSSYIEGQGEQKSQPDGIESPFKGRVNTRDIKEMRTVGPSTGEQLLTFLGIGSLVFLGFIIILNLFPPLTAVD